MDWNDPTAPTALWVFPRGIKQNGGVGIGVGGGIGGLEWVSSYGSVFLSFYDAGNVDGMNEKGLVANILYLTESEYGNATEIGKPTLSVGAWAQYFLDNFATVEEAVIAMYDPPFTVVAPSLPNGRASSVHLSISDVSGDSAVFEYIGGELIIHHSREYKVMTNSPPFNEQLALVYYWRHIGGDRFLPGTTSAADRFVRTDYLLSRTPKYNENDLALGAAFSLIRSVGVPLGMTHPTRPNISMTLWRSVADHEGLRFFFDSAVSPYVIYVSLKKIDFSEGSGTRTIALERGIYLHGDVSGEFEKAEPITWIGSSPSMPLSESVCNKKKF